MTTTDHEVTNHEVTDHQVTEYRVTGMTCGHCEAAVRSEVSEIEGVEQVDVSAKTGSLVVKSSAPVDDALVLAAVDEAGYEAVRV